MPARWSSTSVHCSCLTLPSFWFRPLGPSHRRAAQLISATGVSPQASAPTPHKASGGSENESRLLHLLAPCPTAPSPAPGAHPGAECIPLHPLESLRACSASPSAVGSQTHQEDRNLGLSPTGTPFAGTVLRPPEAKNVFCSFLSQISSAPCNTQQLRATERRRRLCSAPRQWNSSSALSSC